MNEKKLFSIIGKNVKKYRKKINKTQKLTQEMLAEDVGVSVSLISKLESNNIIQGISIDTLYKISIALDVPISKFMEDNNE